MGEFYSIIVLRYFDLANTVPEYLRSVELKLHSKMVCYHSSGYCMVEFLCLFLLLSMF